jgi:DNA-directed RNA polymerase subunit M/transcription elongation factor TFIIS
MRIAQNEASPKISSTSSCRSPIEKQSKTTKISEDRKDTPSSRRSSKRTPKADSPKVAAKPQKKVTRKPIRSSLPLYRQSSLRALVSTCGESSESIERSIFDMCVRLAESTEESVEEVYRRNAYQKIGEIVATSEESLYDSSRNAQRSKKVREKILLDIDRDRTEWESCLYARLRKKQRLELKDFTKEPDIKKAEFQCRNKDCKSRESYFFMRQDRKGDEGMSCVYVCCRCATRTKIAG